MWEDWLKIASWKQRFEINRKNETQHSWNKWYIVERIRYFLTRGGEHKLYHSSNNELRNRYGIFIIVDEEVDKPVIGSVPISERVLMLNIACNEGTINLIQVYAPTVDRSDRKI